jgi:hypothetical protein
MTANTNPIFSIAPDVQWTTIPSGAAANTAVDGTGTTYTAFTADAVNGGFLQSLQVKAATISGNTVLRFFLNNGSSPATPANNVLFRELSLPATIGSSSAAVPEYAVPIGIALPPGYKVLVSIGTSVTGAIGVTGIGGKY